MTSAQRRRAVASLRAARSAPLASDEAASAASITPTGLRARMGRLEPRGRCAQATAAAAFDKALPHTARAAASGSRWIAPGPARRIGEGRAATSAAAVLGIHGWAARTPPWRAPGPAARRYASDTADPPDLPPGWTVGAKHPPLRRERTARDAGCPPALLLRLAADAQTAVRVTAAANPRTPAAALARLAGDASAWAQETATANICCPPAARRSANGSWQNPTEPPAGS